MNDDFVPISEEKRRECFDVKSDSEVAASLIERVIGDLPQDAIDGGWTAAGMSAYAKKLETQIETLRRERDELKHDVERYIEISSEEATRADNMQRERDEAVARLEARAVTVTAEGVQFGNAWFSHEHITSAVPARADSEGTDPIALQYMEWVKAAIAASNGERA